MNAVSTTEDCLVTVCIVNWNSGAYLRRCVAEIHSRTRQPVRILVVDNASTDDSIQQLERDDHKATIIHTGRNLGFAGGVNVAVAEIQTPFILLLNPDAFVHQGCIDALVECAFHHPDAAAIGAGLRNPDGSLQAACRNFPSLITHLIEVFQFYNVLRYVPALGRWYLLLSSQDQTRPVDWVVGACMLLRSDAIREVGQFEATHFMYAEELDWCMRARRRGWTIWFEATAVATHILGGSSRKNELPMMIESYRSMYSFLTKYYSRSYLFLTRAITFMAMLFRILSLPLRGRWSDRQRYAAYWAIARL